MIKCSSLEFIFQTLCKTTLGNSWYAKSYNIMLVCYLKSKETLVRKQSNWNGN